MVTVVVDTVNLLNADKMHTEKWFVVLCEFHLYKKIKQENF